MTPTSEIRVARVITRMNVGGPARHVTILTTQAGGDLNGVLLTGDTDSREGSLLDEAVAAGSRVEKVPGLRRQLSPLHDLQALVWLYRFFRRHRPTLVATHTSKAGALGRLAAFLARVPVRVHTFHGHVLDGYFSGPGTWGFLLAERFLSSLTTHFVAISPKIADDMFRMGIGRGKTSIVRLGLQLEPLRHGRPGVLRAALDVPENAQLVGIVGRLVPIKAHDLFLDAAELVLAKLPTARFVIVGDGDLWDQLHEEVTRRGLEASVRFTGWRQDLADVYADLDVVVCCSRNEGTPVCLIEAGAAGRPVVGTLVGGMPDIITPGVNGLLVPFGDAPALSDAVVRILQTPGLAQEMGAAGQRAAFERHGAERMVADLRSLYERLLSRKQMRVMAG